MVMIIWGVLTWWYTEGWYQCLQRVKDRLEATLDFFSIDLLLRTLFAPFRQISAGSVRGSFEAQMRAFFDQLISRCIGTVARLIMIAIGSVMVVLHLVFGLLFLAMWCVVPLLPLIGLGLFIAGWVPWNE